MTGRIASRWERAAISGITPPYSAKMSIWETTTLARISGGSVGEVSFFVSVGVGFCLAGKT